MKQYILLTWCFCISLLGFGQNQNIAGTWLGTLDVGIKLRLVFHFETDKSGRWEATMDSPDQNAKGIPVSEFFVGKDSVILKMDALKASYAAKIINDSLMEGVFKQGPAVLPLIIKKTGEIAPLNRPQTPKPPFNYKVEEVEFDNKNKTVHLGATLTTPINGNHFPAVILITGSGQQDRDETIVEHKPFAVIADYLTKMGFAVLRVDDRGTGKSIGEVATATSADYAEDIRTSFQWLQGRNEIDKNKIGLLGHSEGGLIALLVAASDPSVNFIISMSGPGTTGTLLMADQNKALLLQQGASAVTANSYKELYEGIANIALSSTTTDSALRSASAYYLLWKMSQPANVLAELNLQSMAAGNQLVKDLVIAFRQPWTKYFMQSDAQALLQNTNVTFLGLFAERDLQVLAIENKLGLEKVLEQRSTKNYALKTLPGLNHLFQTCKTCSVGEYGELEETISPLALQEIGDWLKQNVMEK